MTEGSGSLKHIRIAAPCSVDWDQMFSFERKGQDDRIRFCSQCSLNVYNLSGMTRNEAEALVGRTEGRLCVRFYRRNDGTVLTENCPVGLRAIKRRVAWVGQAMLGMVLSLSSGVSLFNWLAGRELSGMTPIPPSGDFIMGAIAQPSEAKLSDWPAPTPSVPVKLVRSEGKLR